MPDYYFTILRMVVPISVGVVHAITQYKFRNDRRSWRMGWDNPVFAAFMLIIFGYVASVPYDRLWGVPLIFAGFALMLWMLTPYSFAKKTTYAKD